MYTEDDQYKGFFFRNLVLKLLLIITIIFIVIWIIPKFLSYKPSNKKTTINIKEENINDDSISKNLEKLKSASLLYYKENKLPKEKSDIELVTLKELQKEKLITQLTDSTGKACDSKKSYAKLTKEEKDYSLKIYIKCNNKDDYLLAHVGKYSYCTNTICEIDQNKKNENEEENTPQLVNNPPTEEIDKSLEEDSQTQSSIPTPIKLSNFTEWSPYTRIPCSTSEINCNENDPTCLTEIRLKKQTEKVGKYIKEYHTSSLVLSKKAIIKTRACNNYNYVAIQGKIYKTLGNYEEILSLNNRQSTSNWSYKGTISTTETPTFGSNKYYKFIGADFKNCGETCTTNPSYYYDVYEYNKPITKTNSTTENCNSIIEKSINVYQVIKKLETARREEPLYATACYKSIRTRRKIN